MVNSEIDIASLLERVAKIETETRNLESQLTTMVIKLDVMIDRFTRYEAKWGGVLMVVSALVGIFATFHTTIQKFFSER